MLNTGSTKPPSRGAIHRHIADIAGLFGWRYHHATPSLTLDGYTDGFPSAVLVRDGRLVFVSTNGSLTPTEAAWADELARVTTVEMHVIQRGNLGDLTRVLRPEELRTAER